MDYQTKKEGQSEARLPFYLITFTSIKNNNPEVCSCEQGQQGLTIAKLQKICYISFLCRFFSIFLSYACPLGTR